MVSYTTHADYHIDKRSFSAQDVAGGAVGCGGHEGARKLDRPTLSTLFKNTKSRDRRNRLIHTAHMVHGYTLSEIDRHVGLHYATISKIVKRVNEKK